MTTFATHKKAFFDYEVLDTFEAGIALTGSEVKSVRAGTVQLRGNFVRVRSGEAVVENMHIGPYKYSSEPHDPLRNRKLLLHKREILKLSQALDQKGVTGVVLEVYAQHGLIKAKIGLCRGKKKYDKRLSLKKRQVERDIAHAMKKS